VSLRAGSASVGEVMARASSALWWSLRSSVD
jgi:hypothetical protein